MTTFISADCSIAIPAELLKNPKLQPGRRCDIEQISDDELRVKMSPANPQGDRTLLDWLLACPVKDWYVPLERTETTDDLKASPFE